MRPNFLAIILAALLHGCGQSPMEVVTVGDWQIQVAKTPRQQARGLQGITSLKERQGMAFPLPPGASQTAFWMRGCQIPLDLIFIGFDGRILAIQSGDPNSDNLITPVGVLTHAEIRNRLSTIPKSALVIEVQRGSGTIFSKSWHSAMLSRFRHPP